MHKYVYFKITIIYEVILCADCYENKFVNADVRMSNKIQISIINLDRMNDWYRKKTWTKDDEEHFLSKLARARKDGRAQYLKIQVIELIETKNLKLLDIAEMLIDKLLSEYPDNNFEKSSALLSLANIYELRGDVDKAIVFYQKTLDFEIIYPKVITNAFLDFSELVIKSKRTDLYNNVEEILMKRLPDQLFPINKYKAYAILSIISRYKQHDEQAFYFANLAEQYATEKTTGLRYHKDLGVVTQRTKWLDDLVKSNVQPLFKLKRPL